jgi:UDP-2,3-diacylglucosamine hydrolase
LRQFLRGPAREAAALYILGDLFEFWIGDDVLTETAQAVAAELRALREQDVRVYFVHGNRDFLIGPEYARLTGMELLPATSVVDLYGTPSLLLHGDALCTDDEEYQAFRRKVRDPSFQRMFLGSPSQRSPWRATHVTPASATGSASWKIMKRPRGGTGIAIAGSENDPWAHHRPAVTNTRLRVVAEVPGWCWRTGA